MVCQSCGKESNSNALYCDDCMHAIQVAAFNPAPGQSVSVQEGASPSIGAFDPANLDAVRPPATLRNAVIGGATFAVTILVICVGFMVYNAAHASRNTSAVVPDNPAALQAAQNDRGLLLLYKPGDTWTFNFVRHDDEATGPDSDENGQIVEKIVRNTINGKACLVDSAVITTVKADGSQARTTYVACSTQSKDRSLYLLGYGSDDPDKLHWNASPELLAKGDWNDNPSFDIKTETVAGTPSHTYVSVDPTPVVVDLSTGTPVKCWNKTMTVSAGDNYGQTTNELYCPAIGQKINSTDVVIFPDKRQRTTTITLAHYSLAD